MYKVLFNFIEAFLQVKYEVDSPWDHNILLPIKVTHKLFILLYDNCMTIYGHGMIVMFSHVLVTFNYNATFELRRVGPFLVQAVCVCHPTDRPTRAAITTQKELVYGKILEFLRDQHQDPAFRNSAENFKN